jgi:hypothetical protein
VVLVFQQVGLLSKIREKALTTTTNNNGQYLRKRKTPKGSSEGKQAYDQQGGPGIRSVSEMGWGFSRSSFEVCYFLALYQRLSSLNR